MSPKLSRRSQPPGRAGPKASRSPKGGPTAAALLRWTFSFRELLSYVVVQTGALQVLFRREITADHENRIVAPAFSLELVHIDDQVKVGGGHYRLPWRIAQPAWALIQDFHLIWSHGCVLLDERLPGSHQRHEAVTPWIGVHEGPQQ